MTTVAQIAEKYNKGVDEVKVALETLGYGNSFKSFAKVDHEAEGKLDIYWKQKGLSLTERKTVTRQKTSPRERKVGKTQVMEKPRRVFSRPTPAPPPDPPSCCQTRCRPRSPATDRTFAAQTADTRIIAVHAVSRTLSVRNASNALAAVSQCHRHGGVA